MSQRGICIDLRPPPDRALPQKNLRPVSLTQPKHYMPIKPAKSPQKHTRSKQKTEPSSPVLAQHGSYLLQLPSELLTHLTAYLSPVALTTLASVCRLLYDHINQDNTWRCAFLCHFLGISPNPDFPNEHPRLVLLRRSEGSWRTEFQKHWVIAK
jgi:hypothetical protein